MSAFVLACAHLSKCAMIAALAGLLARGGARLCWPLAAYLAALLSGNVLVTLWPETFHTYDAWTVKESVYSILRLLVALDIAGRVFRAFPGARTLARAASVVILVAIAGAAAAFPEESHFAGGEGALRAWGLEIITRWTGGLVVGTIWLLGAVSALVVFFGLPLQPFHRRILFSLTLYLTFFAQLIAVLGRWGWAAREWCSALEAVSSLALFSWWAVVAWRHEDVEVLSPGAAGTLAALGGTR